MGGAQSLRNTTAVPRHWSQKRKYLQGKRGLEKPAFVLPAFIEATGAPAPGSPLSWRDFPGMHSRPAVPGLHLDI